MNSCCGKSAEQSKYLMSDSEEGLAAEMTLSGGRL